MKAPTNDFSSEEEIQAIIDKLLDKRDQLTTPRAEQAFLAKLSKYHLLLEAFRDGHRKRWQEYDIANRHAMYSSLAELYLSSPRAN